MRLGQNQPRMMSVSPALHTNPVGPRMGVAAPPPPPPPYPGPPPPYPGSTTPQQQVSTIYSWLQAWVFYCRFLDVLTLGKRIGGATFLNNCMCTDLIRVNFAII